MLPESGSISRKYIKFPFKKLEIIVKIIKKAWMIKITCLFLFLTKIKIKSKRYKLSNGVDSKVLNWVYVKTGYLDNWKKIKESEIKKREYKKISAK